MNPISETAGVVGPSSLDARRKMKRRTVAGESTVVILDGPNANQRFDTVCRDTPSNETSFLIRCEVRVGQTLRIDQPEAGTIKRRNAEVIRCRLLSNGRYEVTAEYRLQQQAPRPSESQRRHERRRARLGELKSIDITPKIK